MGRKRDEFIGLIFVPEDATPEEIEEQVAYARQIERVTRDPEWLQASANELKAYIEEEKRRIN